MIQYLKIKGLPNKQFNSCGVSFVRLDGNLDYAFNFTKDVHRYPGESKGIRRTISHTEEGYFYVYIKGLGREYKFPIVESYENEKEYTEEIQKYVVMRELIS